ncbi:hypothetical protein ElyMa_005264800 [Elysia marginata]|uniref:Uncharacterized protein n=1 Tax=Elysia marginata TaxID=1093978 RepID=A0AAV4JX68_9GAST|nr:hypothetical protein ElyMa_005264800 [Elysia marginata]
MTVQSSYSRSSSSSTLFEASATAVTHAADAQGSSEITTTTAAVTAATTTATSDVVTAAGGSKQELPGDKQSKQPEAPQKDRSYFTTVFKDESGNKATLLIRNREIFLGNQARVHMIYTVSAISSAIIFAILITDIIRESVDTERVTRDGLCFRGL